MKKSFIASIFLPLSLLFSCSNSNEEQNNFVTLNDFESVSDLYKFKTVRADYYTHLSYELNADSDYVTSGSSSLKLSVSGGNIEELMFPFKYRNEDLFDSSRLNSIYVDVYNSSSKDIALTSIVYNSSSLSTLLSESYVLKQGEWNNIEFKLSSIAVTSNYETIKGLILRFSTEGNGLLYIDNLRVKLGIEPSEEDKQYEEVINSLQNDINALPSEISLNDYDNISSIYERYEALPTIYRRIINNYPTLYKAISTIANIKQEEDVAGSTREIFGFDKFYGVGQIYNHETVGGDLEFNYQHKVKYEDEDGSIRLDFFGSTWNYLGYSLPSDIDDFDYITFNFYNEDEEHNQTKRIYFGWNGTMVDCKPNEWTTINVSASTLANSTYGIIINQLDNGLSTMSSGSIYIGKVIGYRASYKRVAYALNSSKPFESKDAFISNENGLNTISSDSKKNVSISLNKEIESISIGENVLFNLFSKSSKTIELVDLEGNSICSKVISSGWNQLALNCEEYNLLQSINFELASNEKVIMVDPVCYKNANLDLANLLVTVPTLPESSNFGNDDIPLLIQAYETYSSLDNDSISDFRSLSNDPTKISNLLSFVKENSLLENFVSSIMETSSKDELSPLLMSLLNSKLIKENLSSQIYSRLVELTSYYGISYDKAPGNGLDYAYEGSVSTMFDDEMGLFYELNISKLLFPGYIQFENGMLNTSSYSKIVTYVYNPLDRAVPGNYVNVSPDDGSWQLLTSFSLNPKSWNRLEIPSSQITGVRSFLMLMGNLVSSEWKITPYYGISYEKDVQLLNSRIQALPEDADNESSKLQVLSLKQTYDSLNNAGKSYVKDASKLLRLASSINDVELAFPINSADLVFKSESSDFTHGLAYEGNVGSSLTFVNVIKNTSLTKLMSYSSCFFYVYVPEDASSPLYCQQYDVDWAGKNVELKSGYNRISLSKGEWVNNNIDISGNLYMYLTSSVKSNSAWRITSIYGVK